MPAPRHASGVRQAAGAGVPAADRAALAVDVLRARAPDLEAITRVAVGARRVRGRRRRGEGGQEDGRRRYQAHRVVVSALRSLSLRPVLRAVSSPSPFVSLSRPPLEKMRASVPLRTTSSEQWDCSPRCCVWTSESSERLSTVDLPRPIESVETVSAYDIRLAVDESAPRARKTAGTEQPRTAPPGRVCFRGGVPLNKAQMSAKLISFPVQVVVRGLVTQRVTSRSRNKEQRRPRRRAVIAFDHTPGKAVGLSSKPQTVDTTHTNSKPSRNLQSAGEEEEARQAAKPTAYHVDHRSPTAPSSLVTDPAPTNGRTATPGGPRAAHRVVHQASPERRRAAPRQLLLQGDRDLPQHGKRDAVPRPRPPSESAVGARRLLREGDGGLPEQRRLPRQERAPGAGGGGRRPEEAASGPPRAGGVFEECQMLL
ncbi:hypothetical protein THAOC_26378 [Thalassiosira oceanica]|uniref:Uncharacterized protein n=1 Tax=Thalassiosira oceanica TaxID=159749 RepID=K0RP56_THAOC|nr:hypothetical protein THAOC_26378 [Thalassiosira oceanica]|eukprot:EJK54069.1 hypothetical protein THAOC_26378 [Thalassiosira oceanica]